MTRHTPFSDSLSRHNQKSMDEQREVNGSIEKVDTVAYCRLTQSYRRSLTSDTFDATHSAPGDSGILAKHLSIMRFLKTDCCCKNLRVALLQDLKTAKCFGEPLVYIVHNLLSEILDPP